MRRRGRSAVILALLAGACLPTEPLDSVPLGPWGSDSLVLNVAESGASATFNCALGTIDAPLALDAEHRFDLPGTYTQGTGAFPPTPPPPVAARYQGRTDGRTMEITVTLVEPPVRIGTYRLERGRNTGILHCPGFGR